MNEEWEKPWIGEFTKNWEKSRKLDRGIRVLELDQLLPLVDPIPDFEDIWLQILK